MENTWKLLHPFPDLTWKVTQLTRVIPPKTESLHQIIIRYTFPKVEDNYLSDKRTNLWLAGSSRAVPSNNLSAWIMLDSPHATYISTLHISVISSRKFVPSPLSTEEKYGQTRNKNEVQISKNSQPKSNILYLHCCLHTQKW